MGALWSYLFKKKETPIGIVGILQHNFTNHFRGVLGVILPLAIAPILLHRDTFDKTVAWMWIWMAWTIVIQPVNVPVAGIIPVFCLPMSGTMKSDEVCKCYFNENLALYILGGWMLLLLNNSGVDRRLILNILYSDKYSTISLLVRSSLAAFLLSMISNRLIVSANIIQYVGPTLMDLQGSRSSSNPDYNAVRYIIVCAIHTSSAIGSIAFVHSSAAILALKAIFCGSAPKDTEYSDVFSFFNYTVFALPVAIAMYILNLLYYIILIDKKGMTDGSKNSLKKSFAKQKNLLPKKITTHEWLSLFFTIACLALYLSRWSKFFNGWGSFNAKESSPYVKDVTVSAVFVILLSMMPCSFGFLKYAKTLKKSQLPPPKPESAILWWRFIDKNTNYGYLLLIGGGLAIVRAAVLSKLDVDLHNSAIGNMIASQSHNILMLIIVAITVFLSSIMTSMGALIIFLPFVLILFKEDSPHYYQRHFSALAVGMGSSLGFMFPFLYTPAYFAHKVGKVPMKKMALYGLGSTIVCAVVLWLALCFFGNLVLEPKLDTIVMKVSAVEVATEGGEASPPEL